MTEPLGLSIGMTNLVAARVGHPPVTRRSILNLYADRAPEVGAPAEIAGFTEPQLVLDGFVERVGDPVPVVAADGSAHRGEQSLARALDAMARLVDSGAPIAVAVPAHWGPGTVGALRGALRGEPRLSPGGVPPALIPDATAALAALRVAPGLPAQGVIVLVDLGGSGSSVTLADAGSGAATIGQTVRYPEFSGEGIDQALLDHVLSGIASAETADPAGTAGTAAVGPLARLRDNCRAAKERLSGETATAVAVELPGFQSDVRVTRPELEQLISEPLTGLLSAIEDALQRNGIAAGDISAVATVGGGAAIPLVTQRLSERLRAPVITTPQPALNVAAGAALVANQSLAADAPTGMAPAADAPTAMGHAAWAAGAAGLAATESAGDGAPSATFRALAWSQDDEAGAADPLPYTGEDYTSAGTYPDPGGTAARPAVDFARPDEHFDDEVAPLPWHKRPPVLFGVAAAAALLAAGGLAVTLTSSPGESGTVTETAPVPSETVPELPPPVTTVTVGPDGVATTTVSQPPPPPPSPAPTTPVTTTETTSPTTTTTTTTTTSPTTTTTSPTTTTTRTTTTQPTTTQPPPTTTPPPPPTTVQPPPTVDPPDPVVTTVIVPEAGA